MGLKISRRGAAVQPSPTLGVDQRAKELLRQGVDIIGFGAGQPDFPTPTHVKQAGIEAIEGDQTGYTAATGIPELKAAICRKLERENGLTYALDEIVVTVGAKHALFNAFLATLDEGDEVVLPAPYWVSYPEQIRLAGGTPVVVRTDPAAGYKLSAEALRGALTSRTRMLVLNSPNNPTGAVYSADELRALAAVVLEHDLAVVSDEIYEKLLYDGAAHVSIVTLHPDLRERCIVINGVSKAYSMTGWRIGYAAAPREVASAMGRIQGQSTSNPTSISQWAALAALQGGDDEIAVMVGEYDRRRRRIVAALNAMPGFRCPRPEGAFYVFPVVAELLGQTLRGRPIETTDDLAAYFLDEARVALVPGTGFGYPEAVRLSYAIAYDLMEEGLARMAAALAGAAAGGQTPKGAGRSG